MTHPIRTAAVSVAACALLVPATAAARGGHDDDAAGRDRAPARVEAKVKRVVRTLDRVEDHASDGQDAAALAAIAKLDKAVASAQRVAIKRVGTEAGPASVGRVARADAVVATTTAELLDGASEELTTGLAGSLDAALDGRDALVAAVAADPSAFAEVLVDVAEHAADEAEAFTEGATDDEVTSAGAAALRAAAEQATATASAASALAGTDASPSAADGDGAPAAPGTGRAVVGRGDCGPARDGDDTTSGESTAETREGASRRA